jgi:NAD(P)-dependent dehydrogenase (short-subunit alcohol dehydrogenase family)
MPGTTVYGATKAAIVNLVKTLSADLIERGIRVNAISPGPVESALLGRLGMPDAQLQETQDWIKSQVPLKRFAQPAEIAEAVLYLCSGASSFVVGAEIIIDGGMTL